MKHKLECKTCDIQYIVIAETDPYFCCYCGNEIVLEDEDEDNYHDDLDDIDVRLYD